MRVFRIGLIVVLSVCVGLADDTQSSSRPIRQSFDDAWWTGPLLAPGATTLPRGHFLLEPYVYDVMLTGRYDRDGVRHHAPYSHGLGSLTSILYGVTDKITVGLVPSAGYNTVSGKPSSAGPGFGDLSLKAQYAVKQWHQGGRMPTIAVVAQESFPIGKYDQLGNRTSDGMGSGTYTASLALNTQMYFWLPTNRILRMRVDITQTFPGKAHIKDASVYGTELGFRGRASPGKSLSVNAAWEYSMTRNWVLALDLIYGHDSNTNVTGINVQHPELGRIASDSGGSKALGFAPAIEYNFKGNIGVIVGVRVIPVGRNTSATITPAIAVKLLR